MTKILMTHLYYSDPNREFSDQLAETLLNSGADFLEVGIAYTDPVCDGEVFQRACKRALLNGITPFQVLKGIKNIREKGCKNPIYLTSYFAPIYKIGLEKFVSLAKSTGVTGLIIPDLLFEEQQSLRRLTDKYGLSLIQFATVYSTKERLKETVRASTDFIYCVSLPGVTGDKKLALSEVEGLLKSLKSLTDKKIYVGFGIQNRDEVQKILEMGADGVIVGSAIAGMYEGNLYNPSKSLPKISQFINSLKEVTIKEEI
ncbi:tryptophan synthase subunit alpha [Candidatus Gottesmanbacteria bacterium]|nr:tryptophan synthase subunit alpha [Candidatus Gottesmanbacteria bacterium]